MKKNLDVKKNVYICNEKRVIRYTHFLLIYRGLVEIVTKRIDIFIYINKCTRAE